MTALAEAETVPRLERLLRERHPGARRVEVTGFATLPGGLSRLTARFTVTIDGVERDLVARADPPAGTSAADSSRDLEWQVLAALTRHGGVPMPDALYYDDGTLLASPTILLEYLPGGTFSGLVHDSSGAQRASHVQSFAALAADLHAVPVEVLPAALARPADWDAHIDALLAEARAFEREHIESDPLYRWCAAWLDAHRPPPAPLGLVHGEFKPANIVCDAEGRLRAIDWEFAHIGDPREDLGWARLLESLHPPELIGLDESRFCEHYRERSGLPEEVVNPATMSYFLVLAGMRVFGTVMRQVAAFARGANTSHDTGYLVGAIGVAHEQWHRTITSLQASGGSW